MDIITEEELKKLDAEDTALALLAGFKSAEERDDFRYHAVEGMMRFGGSFSSALGKALAHADSKNTLRLLKAFPHECMVHAELHKKFIENRDLINNENPT